MELARKQRAHKFSAREDGMEQVNYNNQRTVTPKLKQYHDSERRKRVNENEKVKNMNSPIDLTVAMHNKLRVHCIHVGFVYILNCCWCFLS